ncbi:hypothetical protein [Halomarina ordinaria]|uniref:Uncharacterized protein n=1 Tax=Halomarina ordinaria TaxID=3033939 RepID=A0ABD5U9S4_9EURY|nr:hypothetical protein [Halomarina sp. PSRA2]
MASPHARFLGGTFGLGLGVSLLVVGTVFALGCLTTVTAIPACGKDADAAARSLLFLVVGTASAVAGVRATRWAWRPPR